MKVEKGVFQIVNRDGTYEMKEGTTITMSPDDIIGRTINEDGSITLEYKNGEKIVANSKQFYGGITVLDYKLN